MALEPQREILAKQALNTKPRSITVFVIGTWISSSVLIGMFIGITYVLFYAWNVYNFYNEYLKYVTTNNLKKIFLDFYNFSKKIKNNFQQFSIFFKFFNFNLEF
jgi:hypothetical protein